MSVLDWKVGVGVPVEGFATVITPKGSTSVSMDHAENALKLLWQVKKGIMRVHRGLPHHTVMAVIYSYAHLRGIEPTLGWSWAALGLLVHSGRLERYVDSSEKVHYRIVKPGA